MLDHVQSSSCRCGHDRDLHDAHGCAAFLGAFEDTAHLKRYCGCRQPARSLRSVAGDVVLLHPRVVTEIRLLERRGSAIGVCEFPPAVELGASAAAVFAAMKTRLIDAIPPPKDGAPQALRIRHDDDRGSRVRLERLR